MDSLELSQHSLGSHPRVMDSPAPRRAASAADRAASPRSAADERRIERDGTTWVTRGGFDTILTNIPDAEWASPAAQGWEMVKKNGAREVWRATIAGRAYYLKYYQRDSWRGAIKSFISGDAAQAEWRGGLFAMQNGIPAARPVALTSRIAREGRIWALLVSEAIEPAQGLDEFWLSIQSDENIRRRREDTGHLIEILAELIARAHQAGFEHLDMHAANILIQPLAPRRYRAVLIDLHSARLSTPLSGAAVVRNLAQLNQWFAKHSSLGDRLRFMRAYLRWRNEFEHVFPHARQLDHSFEALSAALMHGARRHADRLWAQRDRRIGRNGRYFARLRLGNGWRGVACVTSKRAVAESRASGLLLTREWWNKQLANPEALLGADAARLKNSHSAQVARCTLDHPDGPLDVIVKRPIARNFWRSLRSILGLSRAMRGFRIGHALLHRDLGAARPLAALERRSGLFRRDCLLLTETVGDASDLPAHLKTESAAFSPRAWLRHKCELTNLLVRHLRRLHERGFVHRDCKAENILVRRDPLTLLWIDMDGLRRAPQRSRAAELRALTRLHVSLLSVPSLTRTDRARFLKAYCAGYGVDESEWRRVWREMAGLTVQKLRAREKRRAWKIAHYGRE